MHGEVTDPAVDVFDREAVFIERHLKPLLAAVPELKARVQGLRLRKQGIERSSAKINTSLISPSAGALH